MSKSIHAPNRHSNGEPERGCLLKRKTQREVSAPKANPRLLASRAPLRDGDFQHGVLVEENSSKNLFMLRGRSAELCDAPLVSCARIPGCDVSFQDAPDESAILF